jgi:hypothetical protein
MPAALLPMPNACATGSVAPRRRRRRAIRRLCRINARHPRADGNPRNSFPIGNLDCDFVCFAKLNRGYTGRAALTAQDDGRSALEVYVLPIRVVKRVRRQETGWKKVYFRDIRDAEQYFERWDLIRDFLAKGKQRRTGK